MKNNFDSLLEIFTEALEADTKWKPPKDLFTKSAGAIVSGLVAGHGGDIGKSIKSLTFYMNRAGDKLTNVGALEEAKAKLEKRLEREKKKEKK